MDREEVYFEGFDHPVGPSLLEIYELEDSLEELEFNRILNEQIARSKKIE